MKIEESLPDINIEEVYRDVQDQRYNWKDFVVDIVSPKLPQRIIESMHLGYEYKTERLIEIGLFLATEGMELSPFEAGVFGLCFGSRATRNFLTDGVRENFRVEAYKDFDTAEQKIDQSFAIHGERMVNDQVDINTVNRWFKSVKRGGFICGSLFSERDIELSKLRAGLESNAREIQNSRFSSAYMSLLNLDIIAEAKFGEGTIVVVVS